MKIQTPAWVKDAVFYQIFPDRFARSPRLKHPRGIHFKPWGSPPAEQGYQGGDLLGIVDKLDYLQTLGVTAVYLNPIFTAAANHRYHTFDYYEVDPLLGGNAALRELLDAAHARDMRVILDGVFNHTGRGFWQFNHILENGGDSPYLDWFFVQDWPLRPYTHDRQHPPNYIAWANNPMLPKLNTNNLGVRDLIMDVARYWIDFGIDGWRLDVPNEIDDDTFWREFRAVVKQANPEAYIVGEIWHEAQRWLQGDQFDAVMNYRFTVPTLNFFAAQTVRTDYEKLHYDLRPHTAPEFAQVIEHMLNLYDWQISTAQMNLLDSHDTARALWLMGEDKSALQLAVLFQMTMPGAPSIYYGSEIGMSAADDPDCRAAFPWENKNTWDESLLAFYQQAIALRHAYPALRTGSFETLFADKMVYAFWRVWGEDEIVVVFNTATETTAVALHLGENATPSFLQIWPAASNTVLHVENDQLCLKIPAREAHIFLAKKN